MDEEMWKRLRAALPRGKSAEDQHQRKRLFGRFDTQGKGDLTFEAVLSGCYNVLGLGKLVNGVELIVQRAFDHARNAHGGPASPAKKPAGGGRKQSVTSSKDDTVDLLEFRVLLIYLYNYFELYCMFAAIDESGDRRIEIDEFVKAVDMIAKWGVRVEDPVATFHEIDDNHSGFISFDEFVDWATENHLDLDGDNSNFDAVAEEKPAGVDDHGKESPVRKAWTELAKRLPKGSSADDVAERAKLFRLLDWNKGGSLNVTEVQSGLNKTLNLTKVAKMNIIQQVIRRAFQHVKNAQGKATSTKKEPEIVLEEFVMLIHYIFVYFECYVMFQTFDASGDGRIDRDEFRRAKFPLEKAFGIEQIGTLDEMFDMIDDNKSGFILFDELADYVLARIPHPLKDGADKNQPPAEEAAAAAIAPEAPEVKEEAAAEPELVELVAPPPRAAATSRRDPSDSRDVSPDIFYVPKDGRDLNDDKCALQLADPSHYTVGFIDATLTQVIATSPKLQKLTAQTQSPLRRRPKRVVPLLIDELHSTMQVRQKISLRLLLSHLDDFLMYNDTTPEEWEAVLVTLFTFTYRRGGLTPMQSRHNDDASDISFLILHRLFGTPSHNEKFPQALHALKTIMAHLKCAKEDALNRPPPTKLPPRELLDISDYYQDEERAVEAAENEASSFLMERSQVSIFTTLNQSFAASFPLGISPLFFTVDCVAENERIGFSEKDYLAVEKFFLSLDPLKGSTADVDLLAVSWPVVAAVEAGNRIIGRHFITELTLSQWRLAHPDGNMTLSHVLKTLFPFVAEKTLLRRAHGVVMLDDVAKATESLGPIASATQLVVPTSLHRAQTKLQVLQRSRAEPSNEYAFALAEWFDALDYACTGKLTAEQLLRPEGCLQLGDMVLDPVELGGHKGPAGPFILSDLLRVVFPSEVPRSLEALVAKAISDRRDDDVRQTVEKNRLDRAFSSALQAHVKAVEKEQEDETTNPAGNIKSKLSTKQRFRLATEVYPLLEKEFLVVDKAAVDLAERQARRLSIRSVRKDVIGRQRKSIQSFRQTDIPTEIGPEAPPLTVEYHGLIVNKIIFVLDYFAGQPSTRARVSEILTSLDESGIYAGYFLSDPTMLHHFVERPLSAVCFVYRDFAFCCPRPSTGQYWTGNHVLHVKTSIRQFSSIKYRFHLEGYNFGVNKPVSTIVVGYAAKGMIRANSFEAYGWPDGWDKHTALHKGGGIEAVNQYFSSDGHLTLECTARSFSKVGFGISAWLVCADYGSDHHVWAKVVHQEKRL